MASAKDEFDLSPERLEAVKRAADSLYRVAQKRLDSRYRDVWEYGLRVLHEQANPYFARALMIMNHMPVTIDEFIESEEYLGHDPDFKVWPALRGDLRQMNPDIFMGQQHVFQTFDGGATGTGKTHKAHITQMYQLYLLSCFDRPVRLWPRLSSNTPLVFVFQSVQERVTKRVIYEPFRDMFTNIPFVKKNLIWDRDKENVLHLNNNVQVVPALAAVNNIVGQGIVSAILDEVNFMSVVEDSKQVVGARGQGGKFDQAQVIYNNLTRRRKSRFITKGPSPGIISVLSSVRYLGDFMDRRLEEIENKKGTPEEEKEVVVIRRAQYEAQPAEDYSGKKFRLLVGSANYGTRVLKDYEQAGKDYPENARVEMVPVEYLTDFKNDPEGALRDVCGIATDVIAPFITQRHKIIAAIMRGTERNLKCWVDKADIELAEFEAGETPMPQIIEENLPDEEDRKKPRFIHVDLSLTGDRCGIAIVKVAGHVTVANKEGLSESLPHYVLEQGVTIKPSTSHELDIVEVRKWIVALKEYYGFNIHTVSYDGFQSSESMQMLRRAGILSLKISVDETMEPYDLLKAAIYQDRFDCQDHEILKLELAGLERNAKKRKVDHPPKGCHVGETPVLLADGSSIYIKDMVGGTHKIITYGVDGFKSAVAINPRITKEVTELIELELEDGAIYRCTPDHLHLLENGEWVAAKDLKEGDDIKCFMPQSLKPLLKKGKQSVKVKSVRNVTLSLPVPVYDLTVDGTENFCLGSGIVVHNSKDLADAVAGAVFSASQSRVIRADTTVTTSTGETTERAANGRLKTNMRPSSGRRPIRR